jgi:hypothetical protein
MPVENLDLARRSKRHIRACRVHPILIKFMRGDQVNTMIARAALWGAVRRSRDSRTQHGL